MAMTTMPEKGHSKNKTNKRKREEKKKLNPHQTALKGHSVRVLRGGIKRNLY